MSNTLSDLLKRVEEAKGPDRELDGEIMFSLFAKPVGPHGYLWPEDDPSWSFAMRFPGKDREWFEKTRRGAEETILVWRDGDPILINSLRVPKLTASLDSALSLVERMLPGWSLSLSVNAADDHRVAIKHAPSMFEIGPCWVHSGKTPALALLSALLSALIAQDRT